MIHSAGIAFILHTKLTFRVRTLRCVLCRSDGFRIFFRFGKINGNVNLSIRAVHFPADIFFDPIPADIIVILAELIKGVGCLLRVLSVELFKFRDDLGRTRRDDSHQSGVKQISGHNIITVDDSPFQRNVCQCIQHFRKYDLLSGNVLLLILIFPEHFKKLIDHISLICLSNELRSQSIFHQSGNFSI